MKYTAHIRKNETGEIREYKTECDNQFLPTQEFWWKEGNGSCDCNRSTFFHNDDKNYECGDDKYSVLKLVFEDGNEIVIDDESTHSAKQGDAK